MKSVELWNRAVRWMSENSTPRFLVLVLIYVSARIGAIIADLDEVDASRGASIFVTFLMTLVVWALIRVLSIVFEDLGILARQLRQQAADYRTKRDVEL